MKKRNQCDLTRCNGGKTSKHVETTEKGLHLVLTPTRSASLRECIIQGRIGEIGKIKPVTRLVNLNADRKRFWLGRMLSISDEAKNESTPISMNYFDKEEI